MRTSLSIFALASSLFSFVLEGSVKITNAPDGTCTIRVVPPADVEVFIKQSTTETVALPDVAALSYPAAKVENAAVVDPSARRWLATAMFRSYWDYRDTAYMIDALHFASERFLCDTVSMVEDAVHGRFSSSENFDRVVHKVMEQQLGDAGWRWIFGSLDALADADNECAEEHCEEGAATEDGDVEDQESTENEMESGESSDDACADGDEEVLDLGEQDDESDEEEPAASSEEEATHSNQDKTTFANVVDFYHIVLHRIAHLLTPVGASVNDTMRLLEIDLTIVLHRVASRYEQQLESNELPIFDADAFVKIKEAYGAMLLAGRDFLHEKLRVAWAPTVRVVDAIMAKTKKNLDSLNYIDFELWLSEQAQ